MSEEREKAKTKVTEQIEKEKATGEFPYQCDEAGHTWGYTNKEDYIRASVIWGCAQFNKGYDYWYTWSKSLYNPESIYHFMDGSSGNMEVYYKFNREVQKAFPDMRINIRAIVVEGEQVACSYIMTGTHKDTFFGIPATNKQVAFECMEYDRYKDGKHYEGWAVADMLGLMQQLGVIPKSGEKKK